MPIDQMRNKEGFQILDGEIITIVVSRGPPEGLGGLVSGQQINAQEVVISEFPGLSMGYMFLASQSGEAPRLWANRPRITS